MKRSTVLIMALAMSIAATTLAGESPQSKEPRLTVIYYYLPG